MTQNDQSASRYGMSETFNISRGWVRTARLGGCLLTAFALHGVALHVADPNELSAGGAALNAVFWVTLSAMLFRSSSSPSYTVEISDEGVRGGGADGIVPWSAITALRERANLQRVDLLTSNGGNPIRLEYQLDGFERLLETVISRAALPPISSSQRFVRPTVSALAAFEVVAVVSMSALGAWVWASNGEWIGLVLAIGLPIVVGFEKCLEVRVVEIGTDSLFVRTVFKSREIRLRQIASVELRLKPIPKGAKLLEAFLTETSGEQHAIRVVGVSPFDLVRSLKAAVEIASQDATGAA